MKAISSRHSSISYVWRRTTKTCAAVLLILFLLFPVRDYAETGSGDGADSAADEQIEAEFERMLGETDLSAWQRYFDELTSYPGFSEYGSAEELLTDLASGRTAGMAGPKAFGEKLLQLFMPGVGEALRKLAFAACAAVLTGLVSIVLDSSGLKKLALLLISGVVILSAAAVFSSIAADASNLVSQVADFSEAATPVLGLLLTAMGCSASAKLLTPKLAFIAGGAAAFIRTVIVPMLLASGVMTVLNGLSDRMKLDRLIKLLSRTAKWLLGLLTAVFTAVTVASGIAASAADGVTLRTARYAVDKLIPSVGGMVTGAVDAVRSAALLLKNGAGLTALLLLAAVLIRPLLTIAANILAFRLTAAVCEPFSDPRIPAMLDGIADTVSLLFACAAAAAAMLAVTLVVMISAGGALAGA